MMIDQRWLNDVVVVEPYLGEGDYNKPEYGEPIELAHCLVDLKKQYTGVGNDRTIVANATVFLYADFTSNFPADIDDTWLKSRLTYRKHAYVVSDYAPFKRVTSSDLFSIELQVI